MAEGENNPPCEGIEKVIYPDRCKYCKGNGWYNYQGTTQKLVCDYYEDFLKQIKHQQDLTETQKLQRPRNTDTRKTRRMAPFEDLPPKLD